jgi:hypothetical protein
MHLVRGDRLLEIEKPSHREMKMTTQFKEFRESLQVGTPVAIIRTTGSEIQEPFYGKFISRSDRNVVIHTGDVPTTIGIRKIQKVAKINEVFPLEEGHRVEVELETARRSHLQYLKFMQDELQHFFDAGAEIVMDQRGRVLRPGDKVFGHDIDPLIPFVRLAQ